MRFVQDVSRTTSLTSPKWPPEMTHLVHQEVASQSHSGPPQVCARWGGALGAGLAPDRVAVAWAEAWAHGGAVGVADVVGGRLAWA